MADGEPVQGAVRQAIVVAAQAAAYERVSVARAACARLGRLSSGRWRSAARELEQIERDLEGSLANLTGELAERAEHLGVHEEALWTAGDAAAVLDELREATLQSLGQDSTLGSLMNEDGPIFGATFLDDAESENRGTTLLFCWADPLRPVAWPWEASWISLGEGEEEEGQELDLFRSADMEVGAEVLDAVARTLAVESDRARAMLEELASTFTRASLLALVDQAEEDEDWESKGA